MLVETEAKLKGNCEFKINRVSGTVSGAGNIRAGEGVGIR